MFRNDRKPVLHVECLVCLKQKSTQELKLCNSKMEGIEEEDGGDRGSWTTVEDDKKDEWKG